MSTILVPTRQLVGLLSDLILTSGTDPDVPATRGILLHTADGEYLPDLPGADPDQEPLFGPSGAQLLVGTSTDFYAVGQAHAPADFGGPIGWLTPAFVSLSDAQAVAREYILNSGADMLVNPVNTVGVMGKGLALQFKRTYRVRLDTL